MLKKLSYISYFLSLLIIIVLALYSYSALNQFYKYKNAVNPTMELTLDRFHFFLKNEFKREWIKLISPKPLSDENSSLKTFRITIKQKYLDMLNANLPSSGKEQFVDAFMSVSDEPKKTRKIQLRYRGDNNFHWLYKQKSLRIKLAKNDIYNMEKKFNLINPPHWYSFRDIVNYDIAKELGLITPDFFPVRVFINGKYMGVYIYLSQVDESLLRKHKIMPGSIYYGDGVEKTHLDENGMSILWKQEQAWDKKAARNAEQKANREDIQFFINAINNYTDKEFYDFVENMLDKKKFFTFIALDRLFGTNHHDFMHNHKIYFDPYKGKFEPIEWDIRFWAADKIKDRSYYELLHRIKLNPIYDYEIDKIVYDLIKTDILKKIQTSYFKEIKNLYPDLKADIFRDTAEYYGQLMGMYWVSIPIDLDEMDAYVKNDINVLKNRFDYLLKLFNDTQILSDIKKINSKEYQIKVSISGNSPADITFNDKLFKVFDLKAKPIVPKRLYSTRIEDLNANKQNIVLAGEKRVIYTKNIYSFTLKSKKELSLEEIKQSITYKNAITQKTIIPKYENIKELPSSDSSFFLTSNKQKTKVLSGTIIVDKTLAFDKFTSVVIKPDTTFMMDSNTSIYFFSKVTAIGTKDKPIKFIAKDPKKPWGLVAVQGKATSGSIFEYVNFENGSIDTKNLIHYTALFNIHNTNNFTVKNCKIGRNFLGDDAMHIAYANGIVDSCEFINARSDGLDIDIADVNITNSIFYASGNDGLDVMTSRINASQNLFIDTADKGISVGEWSDANITDSIFIRTAIGIEIKDKSKVKVDDLIFIDSKDKAINLYNKNKRYDTGGFLEAKHIYTLGNHNILKDRLSQKTIQTISKTLPTLKNYQWYQNIKTTKYIKLIDEVEVKYAN